MERNLIFKDWKTKLLKFQHNLNQCVDLTQYLLKSSSLIGCKNSQAGAKNHMEMKGSQRRQVILRYKKMEDSQFPIPILTTKLP